MSKEIRSVPFLYDCKQVSEEGEFEGYGSIFDDEEDSYGDIIAPGCFTKTLQMQGRNRNGIAMLFQHDSGKPCGIWTALQEDQVGLKVKGKLAINTTIGRDCYELMKMGALKGLSIGFTTKKYEMDQDRECRILKEVELWEISPVTFPAKVNANITQVKAIEEAKTERDLENALRESGLSKSNALYIVKLCKPALRESAKDESQDLKSILNCLRETNKNFF